MRLIIERIAILDTTHLNEESTIPKRTQILPNEPGISQLLAKVRDLSFRTEFNNYYNLLSGPKPGSCYWLTKNTGKLKTVANLRRAILDKLYV